MNPFIQRGRITDPQHFIGRWRELSVVFDRIAGGRPVLVTGVAGIGKSSLLTHVAQSAAVNLERPELDAFYVNLSVLPDAAACYELLMKALGGSGSTAAAVEVALLDMDDPVMLCLDDADRAIEAGWGAEVLGRLARIARHSFIKRPAAAPVDTDHDQKVEAVAPLRPAMQTESALYLVAAVNGPPPVLSEPFTVVGMGALAPAEVRLLTDAYLEGTGVSFSPGELREISTLSIGHPAYLQRAAFHLFRAHMQPDYDWRAAYLAEAHDQPVPGAPLPPAIFEGGEVDNITAFYGDLTGMARRPDLQHLDTGSMTDLLAAMLPIIAALLAWQFSANWLVGVGVLLASIALVVLVSKLRAPENSGAHNNVHEKKGDGSERSSP